MLRLAFAALRHGNGRLGSVTHRPSCFKIAVVATSLHQEIKDTLISVSKRDKRALLEHTG